MAGGEWSGNWYLLWRLRFRKRQGPSCPAPGARAVLFDLEVPKHPWPEWLNGRYEVLRSETYRSSSQSAEILGEIGR
jgi:hypothetical protein